uniref:ABC transporter domain-containing protein n=1 Tax=Auxenochlorella protothecoides TaxID=3075 RepID=A0A1D2A8G4_AUXPR
MYCPVPQPSTWPALMQIPRTARRAEPWRPAAAMLYTGDERGASEQLANELFIDPAPSPAEEGAAAATFQEGLAVGAIYASGLSQLGLILGSDRNRFFPTYYVEPSLISTRYYNASLTAVVRNASSPSVSLFLDQLGTSLDALSNAVGLGLAVPSISPVTGEPAWQANASAINRFLYCGYPQIRCGGRVQEDYEVSQAWDFQNTSVETGQYNVRMWFNGTGRVDVYNSFPSLLRVNQGINLAANSFLQRALGPGYQSRLLGFQEMPKDVTRLTVSISTLLGPLFFVWLSQLLLPTMLLTLVYEKEKRLRTMMKMHGLGDGAYWLIQYTWFFIMNFLFSMILVGMGWAVDLPIFRLTSYSYTVVFYFLWCNCLIGFAFLLSTLFTSSRTAVVTAFLLIFGTGLIGFLLLSRFIDNGHWWVIFLELIPGFALYRGFYEMGAYAFRATFSPGSTRGLQWSTLSDPGNGSIAVLIIFAVEWVVFLLLAWYLEQVIPSGIGVTKHPLFFLGGRFSKRAGPQPSKAGPDAVEVIVEPEDVQAERARVENGGADEACIQIKSLVKIFPAVGGNKRLAAVKGLTMAVERGECFGLLGPNGAGKSTTVNILTGFLTATHGSVIVEGHDTRNGMRPIHSIMGVCPQDNLLWEQLTARQHLSFYGRLKGLKGEDLETAIIKSLASVNLLHGRVGEKQVLSYSGGMKRRLSVAISFIGSPVVVYLDEPSTGLDPASRHNLWDVVKEGKEGRGIVLTTHSMEEANILCDRLGIFVDGQLVCLGTPKDLTTRFGGYYVFTIMTPAEEGESAHRLVLSMSPNARQTYSLAGTRKYELPVSDVTLAGVFEAMTTAAAHLTILDWGIANATLEEVFIKLAKHLGVEGGN